MPATWPDLAVIAIKALSVVVVLEAAGLAMFIHALGLDTGPWSGRIRRSALRFAEAGAILTIVQHVVAPARLAGSFEGIADASLQAFYLSSDASTAGGLRLAGMVAVILGVRMDKRPLALTGAALACLSFAAMGHTITHEPRWLLAALLVIHIAVVALWLGSLRPLRRIANSTGDAVAGQLERFSRTAGIAVPFILVAGVVLAAILLKSFEALTTPYGFMIIAKLAGFALLIGMASVNRWRLVPGIRTGDRAAASRFRSMAAGEWLVIVLVILVTEAMTSLVSP